MEFLGLVLMFKPIEDRNKIYLDFFKNMFPFSESSLLRISTLLDETNTNIKEFRLYFYKTVFEEEFEDLKFEEKSITSIFYWYALEKISNDFPDFNYEKSNIAFIDKFTNLYAYTDFSLNNDENEYNNFSLLDSILVDDTTEPPFFKLSDTNIYNDISESKIKSFILNLIDFYKKIPEYTQTKLFKWLIKQILSDILIFYYVFSEKELFNNIIMKHNSKEGKFFQINLNELNKLLNS